MESSIKGLLLSSGIIVSCVIIALGFYMSRIITRNIMGESSVEIHNSFVKSVQDIKIEKEESVDKITNESALVIKKGKYEDIEEKLNRLGVVISGTDVKEILSLIYDGAGSISGTSSEVLMSASVYTKVTNITYQVVDNIYAPDIVESSVTTNYKKGSNEIIDKSNIAYIYDNESFSYTIYRDRNGAMIDIDFTQISSFEIIDYKTGSVKNIVSSNSYKTILEILTVKTSGMLSGKNAKRLLELVINGAYSYIETKNYKVDGTFTSSNTGLVYINVPITTKLTLQTIDLNNTTKLDYTKQITYESKSIFTEVKEAVEYIDISQNFKFTVTKNTEGQILNIILEQSEFRIFDKYISGTVDLINSSENYNYVENYFDNLSTSYISGKEVKEILGLISSGIYSSIITKKFEDGISTTLDNGDILYLTSSVTTKLTTSNYSVVNGEYKDTKKDNVFERLYEIGSRLSSALSEPAYIADDERFIYELIKNDKGQLEQIIFIQKDYRVYEYYQSGVIKKMITSSTYKTIESLLSDNLSGTMRGSQVKQILNAINNGAYSYIETKNYFSGTGGTSSTSNTSNFYITAPTLTKLNLTTYEVANNEYIPSTKDLTSNIAYSVGNILFTDKSGKEYIDPNQIFTYSITKNAMEQITKISFTQNAYREYTIYNPGTTKKMYVSNGYNTIVNLINQYTDIVPGSLANTIINAINGGAYSYIERINYYSNGTNAKEVSTPVYVISPTATKLVLTIYSVINNVYTSSTESQTANTIYQSGSTLKTSQSDKEYIDIEQNFTFELGKNSLEQITDISFVQSDYRSFTKYNQGTVVNVNKSNYYDTIKNLLGSSTSGTLTGTQVMSYINAITSGAYSNLILDNYDISGTCTTTTVDNLYINAEVTTKAKKTEISYIPKTTYTCGSTLITDNKDITYIAPEETFTFNVEKNLYGQITKINVIQDKERIIPDNLILFENGDTSVSGDWYIAYTGDSYAGKWSYKVDSMGLYMSIYDYDEPPGSTAQFMVAHKNNIDYFKYSKIVIDYIYWGRENSGSWSVMIDGTLIKLNPMTKSTYVERRDEVDITGNKYKSKQLSFYLCGFTTDETIVRIKRIELIE